MIDHYNAFISYKHAPLDSKIAARVQRKLEHFSVPPKIAKSCGKKKIERVFRDKDELPITSDLSETIEQVALCYTLAEEEATSTVEAGFSQI